jgi:competence protein ComEC
MIFNSQLQQNAQFNSMPLVWLAVFFVSGIWLSKIFAPSSYLLIPLFLLLIPIICFSLIKKNYVVPTTLVLASFLIAGNFLALVEKQSVKPNRVKTLYESKAISSYQLIELTGQIINEPEMTVDGYYLLLRGEKIRYQKSEQKVSGDVRIFLSVQSQEQEQDFERLEIEYGARVKVPLFLNREDNFRNPGSLSFSEILDQNGLDATATVKSPLLIERLENGTVWLPLVWIYEARKDLIIQTRKLFSPETSGVLLASLLNNRYFLSKSTSDRFREGGTFHILVISGLHITFLGLLGTWLTRRFTSKKFWIFFWPNLGLWLYSVMVGAETPVTRAALMFTIITFAPVVFRQTSQLNSLGAAVILLLLWRPSDLFDQSFQLTMLSVTALFGVCFPLLEKLEEIGSWKPSVPTPVPPFCAKWLIILAETLFWDEQKWTIEKRKNIWDGRLFKSDLAKTIGKFGLQAMLRYVFAGIIVSLIIQLWLTSKMVTDFHRFAWSGLLLNLVVGLLMAVLSLLALLALLMTQLSSLAAAPLVWLAEITNWLMVRSIDPLMELGLASIRLPVYSGWMRAIYWLYYIPLIFLAIWVNKWNPFEAISVAKTIWQKQTFLPAMLSGFAVLFSLIIFHPYSAPKPDGRLKIDFLDVGQGDSVLLTMPDGTTLLVDGGGRISNRKMIKYNGEIEIFEPDTRTIGESVVCEFLWEKGIDKVDYLLATHADADHIDGLNDVAKNFNVKGVFIGTMPENDEDFVKLSETLKKNNLPTTQILRGNEFELGGAKIKVVFPERDESKRFKSSNNNSIVLVISFGERKILLTGDIEKEAEASILNENLAVDMVKVPHHGSRTSSTAEFIAATKAHYAIISVGRHSQFGHPHLEVIERWKQSGAKILTTGQKGTITFSTDGKDLQLETFVK